MRIIAGTHRGRRLASAPEGVRPTSDRVRESIFSILGSVAEARVLDLFAGTGALGLEALSRGAASLVLVDKAQGSLRAIRRNLDEFDDLAARVRVMPGDAIRLIPRLAAEGRTFDLVFVDPPYAADLAEPVLERLASSGVLASGARVVLERSKRHDLPPISGLRADDERTYGETVIEFLTECRLSDSPAEA